MQRPSIDLNKEEIEALNLVAEETGSIAKTAQHAGKPSWRVLMKRIARGELKVIESQRPPR